MTKPTKPAAGAENAGGDHQLIGAASTEQIDLWKSKHGKIFQLTVEDHVAYFRKPDRKALAAAMRFGANDPMKFNETIFQNCWLGGSDEIQKNDDFFITVAGKLGDMIQIKEAELKEL